MKYANNLGSKGFSLVQVMIAIGLTGGLALTMMRLMDNQNKQQKTTELRAESNEILQLLRQTAREKDACQATFIGMSPGDSVPEIRLTTNMSVPPFAKVGTKFRHYNVYVKSMELLTRAEELSSGFRKVGTPAIFDYTTGRGVGILKVSLVKNVGEVSDLNVNHNFFGAKEIFEYVEIHGNFYDVEIVKHNDETKLEEACYARAALKGVSCNGAANEPCSLHPILKDDGSIESFTDIDAGGTKLYIAECRYYRDDSPFIECAGS